MEIKLGTVIRGTTCNKTAQVVGTYYKATTDSVWATLRFFNSNGKETEMEINRIMERIEEGRLEVVA